MPNPIIDAKGLFSGQRLRRCSDFARYNWAYLYTASNGCGRLELDYAAIRARCYVDFEHPPSESQFWEIVSEFYYSRLLFVYRVDGKTWGQWDTPSKFLPRHRTREDIATPEPPELEYKEWLSSQQNDSKDTSAICGILPKISENFRAPRARSTSTSSSPSTSMYREVSSTTSAHAHAHAREENSPASFDVNGYCADELAAWLRQNYPRHRQYPLGWDRTLGEVCTSPEIEQRIRSGLAACKESEEWGRGVIPNLGPWLEGLRFENPPPARASRGNGRAAWDDVENYEPEAWTLATVDDFAGALSMDDRPDVKEAAKAALEDHAANDENPDIRRACAEVLGAA